MASSPKLEPNRERYLAVLRGMSPEQRLAKAIELSEMTHDLLRQGIRSRFPGASEAEVQRVYLERLERCRRRSC